MALRLSSSTAATTVDGFVKQITDDTSISLEQKNTCLKTLSVVLKNLIDASKGGLSGEAGLKYRTLKLDNAKLQSRLFCCSAVRGLLLSNDVGMVAVDNPLVMKEAPSSSQQDTIGLKVLPAITTAQQTIASRIEKAAEASNKKAKLTEHNGNATTSSSLSSAAPGTEKLSEKQKARRLLAEKERLEKEREKAFRKETKAKIAADKLVRQKDENWKPSVSAAADKTGTGLLTFRDRHGE